MASPQEELIDSLKQLYDKPEFADLDIVSSVRTLKCHKVVVCPRSPYLSNICQRETARSDRDAPSYTQTISLEEFDAHGLELVIEYLYKLDYSADSIPPSSDAGTLTNSHTDPDGGVKLANGHATGTDSEQDAIRDRETSPSVRTEATIGEPLDDFLSIPPAGVGKKAKRKKRRATNAAPAPQRTESWADAVEDSQLAVKAKPGPQPELEDTLVDAPSPSARTLTTHAKVYALAAEFGIAALATLALAKFVAQASEPGGWDAADFLAAANEAYGMGEGEERVAGDEGESELEARARTIREVVLQTMVRHQELLDHDEMEKIGSVRPKLMYDLLRRVRESGGFVNGV